MIRRPLFVAGIAVILGLCILTAAGLPILGKPAEQDAVIQCIDTEETVKITGLIYQRVEKSNSIQYYIKEANLNLTSSDNIISKDSTHISTNQNISTPANILINQNISIANKIPINQSISYAVNISINQSISYAANIPIKQNIPIPQNIIVIIGKENQPEPLTVGSKIQVEGILERIESPGNPGQFDSESYYGIKGIGYTVWAEKIEVLTARVGWGERIQRLREKLVETLNLMLPQRHAGVLAEMLLGDKNNGDPETKVNYQVGGVMHILSISGLHLSLLGMGCYRLLCRIRLPGAVRAVAAGILMGLYSWFTGSNVGTLRALVMFYMTLGSKVSGGSYDPLSSISLALILLLLGNPRYLLYSGFQLSFVAVLGAGVIYPVWRDALPEKQKVKDFRQRWKRLLKDGILSTLILTLTTLPLICYYLHEIPLLGLIPNLLILLTLNGVMVPGALGMGTGVFNLTAGKIILLPVWWLLELYEILLKMIRMLPWSVYICGQPQLWQVLVYYICYLTVTYIIWWNMNREEKDGGWKRGSRIKGKEVFMEVDRLRFIWIANITLLVAGIWILLWRPSVEMSLTILDVGQGDSIVLRSGTYSFLVDGGSSSKKQVGTYRILPYLKSQGVQNLDGIIITHMDEDHMNGILELLEKVEKRESAIRIQQLFLPVWMKGREEEIQFLDLAKRAGVSIAYLQKGDRIQKGDFYMEVLHPDENGSDGNAGSVTLGVHYQGFHALLTGDLEGRGEEQVMQELAAYDYLKVAHHGSKNSTSMEFLDKVNPQIAVISCGKKNYYGHPHGDLLERLKSKGVKILATSDCGAVTLWRKGGKSYVTTFSSFIVK